MYTKEISFWLLERALWQQQFELLIAKTKALKE